MRSIRGRIFHIDDPHLSNDLNDPLIASSPFRGPGLHIPFYATAILELPHVFRVSRM
jgi:hypothetical protein